MGGFPGAEEGEWGVLFNMDRVSIGENEESFEAGWW